jgi:hypothetical protein
VLLVGVLCGAWIGGVGNQNHLYYRNRAYVRGAKSQIAFSRGRMTDITDEASNVLLFAEKFVDPSRYRPASFGDEPAGVYRHGLLDGVQLVHGSLLQIPNPTFQLMCRKDDGIAVELSNF